MLKQWTDVTAELREWLTDDVMWIAAGLTAVKIVLILILSRAAAWSIHKVIQHTVLSRNAERLRVQPRRVQTIGKLLKNVVSYVVYFIAFLLVLAEFRIDLAPLLAGAGVVGLAIGFGAQSLVKDVLAGIFIIVEDQFAVGDVIQTGQFKGTVEVIGLRTTRLQSWTGEVFIIPNGLINEVTNFSLRNTLAIVDVPIAKEEDIDRAMTVMRETVQRVEDPNLTKVPEVLGVQTIGPTEVTIRIVAECRPNTHPVAARTLNAEIKKALDAEGIEMPYPKTVTFYKGERGGA